MLKKYRIKYKMIDGKRWFIPHRRVWIFFWTKEFKCPKDDCTSQSMRSLDVKDAIEFIENRAMYNMKRRAQWQSALKDEK